MSVEVEELAGKVKFTVTIEVTRELLVQADRNSVSSLCGREAKFAMEAVIQQYIDEHAPPE